MKNASAEIEFEAGFAGIKKKALATRRGREPESYRANRTVCHHKSTLARTSGAHSGLNSHQSRCEKKRDAE